MLFGIVNESQDPNISLGVLEQIGEAVQRQLYEHYGPFWESSGAPVRVYSNLDALPANASPIVILDDPDQAGVLGYHDVTRTGKAYARVFWKPIQAAGGTLTLGSLALSVTVSHEVLEIIGDPYASFWAANPKTQLLHAFELCDACEMDSYIIDGVSVSNFIGPRFFRQGPGPYDWKSQQDGSGSIKEPFISAPNGYQIVAVNMSNVTAIFGAEYPEWKKEQRRMRRRAP